VTGEVPAGCLELHRLFPVFDVFSWLLKVVSTLYVQTHPYTRMHLSSEDSLRPRDSKGRYASKPRSTQPSSHGCYIYT